MFEQKIHAPVKVLNLDRLFNVQVNILINPFFNSQFGRRCQGSVGNHSKDRISNRCFEGSIFQCFSKTIINSDTLPQPLQQKSPTSRLAGYEFEICALGSKCLYIFRAYEPAQTADKTLKSRDIKLIPPPEGVYDLGSGIAFLRVAGIVGQLNIFDLRPILVPAFYCAYIHAHIKSIYFSLCQEKNEESCAYRF